MKIFRPIETESPREEIDPKKSKRGPSIKLFGDEVCSICGRKADGFHYNVLSCQGKFLKKCISYTAYSAPFSH